MTAQAEIAAYKKKKTAYVFASPKSGCSIRRLLTQILALLLPALLLCGCAGAETQSAASPAEETITETITEGRHDREEGYMASFQTHLLSSEGFTLHMENKIYDEDALRRAAQALRDDLAALEKAAGVKPESVTVYLVKQTPDGCCTVLSTKVFCSLGDFVSGAYREALAGAAYALPCAWQRVGLAELVFGEEISLRLQDYYAGGAHALTASCSAIHFSPVLSDEETVSAARATARSLTAFLLECKGFSAFREAEDTGAILPAWADSLGVSPAPCLPEGSAAVAGLRQELRTGCLCVLKVKNFSVMLSENSWLLDPDGLYDWFCGFFAGMDLVMAQIREEAPSALSVAEAHYSEPITIVFADSGSMTYTSPFSNTIELSSATSVWHEMIHLLLEEPMPNKELEWLEEPLAEHFSYRAQAIYAPTRYYSEGYEAYLRFFEEASGAPAQEDDLLFHRQVWDLYQRFLGTDKPENDDPEAYCRAYGIVSLLSEGKLVRTQQRQLYDLSIAAKRGESSGAKKSSGSALSYPESLVIFEYLAERCGTDAVIDAFLNGVPFEKAFGISYPSLYREATTCFAQQYASPEAEG